MYKFKIWLFILLFPSIIFLYYFTSFEHGFNALLEKKSELNALKIKQDILESKIKKVMLYNNLLNANNPDLDFLEEKSLEILGRYEKDAYHIKF